MVQVETAYHDLQSKSSENGSEIGYVAGHYEHVFCSEADYNFSQKSSRNSTTMRAMAGNQLLKNLFTVLDHETESYLKSEETDLAEDVKELCNALDDLIIMMIRQAYRNGEKVSEDHIQNMFEVTSMILITALKVQCDLDKLDARTKPGLHLQIGAQVINGYTDMKWVFNFLDGSGEKGVLDVAAIIAELKAEYAKSKTPESTFQLVSQGLAKEVPLAKPLNKRHLNQLFLQMLGIIGRNSTTRPVMLQDISKSPVRMYGLCTNGVAAVTATYCGQRELKKSDNPQENETKLVFRIETIESVHEALAKLLCKAENLKKNCQSVTQPRLVVIPEPNSVSEDSQSSDNLSENHPNNNNSDSQHKSKDSNANPKSNTTPANQSLKCDGLLGGTEALVTHKVSTNHVSVEVLKLSRKGKGLRDTTNAPRSKNDRSISQWAAHVAAALAD